MLALFGLTGWAVPADAQEMDAPMGLQVTTLVKILEFDRSFHERVGEEVVVGIAYQSLLRPSANALRDLMEAVRDQALDSIRGIPVRFVPLDLGGPEDLEGMMDRHHIDFLYVAPLRSVSLRGITAQSRASAVPTLTGVADYVNQGIGVGVTVQGQRLRILVNLPAARAEGMDLSSELLKLATVLGDGR